MLRHVVLFRWKKDTTAQQIQVVSDALGRLPSEIPEIAAYNFGPDAGLSEGAEDFAVVADFASAEDWRAYIAHPAHVRLVEEVLAPIRESRVVLQFEMEDQVA